jgi:phytoene/squalene synthetase
VCHNARFERLSERWLTRGIALLAPQSRYTVRLALSLYRGILGRIDANAFDVFTRRAYVPFRTKMLTALTVVFTG